MKSLSDIVADNAEIESRIEAKHAASIRRLKRRIARALRWDYPNVKTINAAIDKWSAAERKRSR